MPQVKPPVPSPTCWWFGFWGLGKGHPQYAPETEYRQIMTREGTGQKNGI
jgi:hypothetical protein